MGPVHRSALCRVPPHGPFGRVLRRTFLTTASALATTVMLTGCQPAPSSEEGEGRTLTEEEARHFDDIKAGLDGGGPVIEVSPCSDEKGEGCLTCENGLRGLRVDPPRVEVDCFGLVNREWCFDNRTKVRWIAVDFPDYPLTLSIDAKDDSDAFDQLYGSVQRDIRQPRGGVWSRLPGRLTQDTEVWRYQVTVSPVGGADEYCADPEIEIHRRR